MKKEDDDILAMETLARPGMDDLDKDYANVVLRIKSLDEQFLEFLGDSNYAWNFWSHLGLKPAAYREYRGAEVRIAWDNHDATDNNFGIQIKGQEPYLSKNYKDERLCRAAAFTKVMLLTGADRDDVVAWWNKRCQ